MKARTILAVPIAGLALAGCGYKGPLTLPEKPGEVTTRPGPAEAKTPPETAPGAATRTGGSGG